MRWNVRMRLQLVMFAFAIHSGVAATCARAQEWGLQDQFILSSFHLGVAPDKAAVAPAGAFETSLRMSVTNTYLKNDVYTVDLEQRLTELLLTYGLTDKTQIDIGIPLIWRGGGVFDNTIRQWHKWWGLPSADRQFTKNNQFLVEGQTDSGSFSIPEAGFGFGNVTARMKRQLSSSSGNPSDLVVSSALTLSLPTAEPGFGQDLVDSSLEVLAGLRSGSWEFNAGVGAVVLLDRFEKGIEYKPIVPQGFISTTYQAFDDVQLLVSSFGGVQTIDNVPSVPEGFVYVDFGVQVGVGEGTSCAVVVRENPYPSRATADVSVSASCAHTW